MNPIKTAMKREFHGRKLVAGAGFEPTIPPCGIMNLTCGAISLTQSVDKNLRRPFAV
jgi:hypothetical protein